MKQTNSYFDKLIFDRHLLTTLVLGSTPNYTEFDNPIVLKAGFSYSYDYDKTSWNKLKDLSNDELCDLYLICRNSWQTK